MFGWTRQHYVIAAELRHARTSRNLAQSPAISRNLPPPPEGTIVRQGLHMSGGSPGKNGDGVIVRLATLTQWAVSAMLNTGRIHIFMRINLLYITRRTRARAPIPGIGRKFPNEPDCRIDSRCASDANNFRPKDSSARHARRLLSGGTAAMVVHAFYSD